MLPFHTLPQKKHQKTYEFFEDFLKTWNHIVKLELALIRRLTISEFNESQASTACSNDVTKSLWNWKSNLELNGSR